MRLYDIDSSREDFMETVYSLLASDPDTYRANQIISAFDSVKEVEAVSIEIPFEELESMNWRAIYVLCRDDPSKSGWATLKIEQVLDETIFELKFLDKPRRQIYLRENNYRRPWIPCYREPGRTPLCTFVSGERDRRLKADFNELKDAYDALQAQDRGQSATA